MVTNVNHKLQIKHKVGIMIQDRKSDCDTNAYSVGKYSDQHAIRSATTHFEYICDLCDAEVAWTVFVHDPIAAA